MSESALPLSLKIHVAESSRLDFLLRKFQKPKEILAVPRFRHHSRDIFLTDNPIIPVGGG